MMDRQVFLLLGKQDKGNKEKQFSRKKLDFWMSETEDGDSDGGHDEENDDDDCDGDSIVVDDDIHEGSTVDFVWSRERESSSSEMMTCKCKSWAVSFRSWVLTLEVLASTNLGVGRSIKVRLKIGSNLSQKHHFILKQTLNGSSISGPHGGRQLLSRTVFSFTVFLK